MSHVNVTGHAAIVAANLTPVKVGAYLTPEGFFVHAVDGLDALEAARGYMVITTNGGRYWAVGEDALNLLRAAKAANHPNWTAVLRQLCLYPQLSIGIAVPVAGPWVSRTALAHPYRQQSWFDGLSYDYGGLVEVTNARLVSALGNESPALVFALPNGFLRGRGSTSAARTSSSDAVGANFAARSCSKYVNNADWYLAGRVADTELDTLVASCAGYVVTAVPTDKSRRAVLRDAALRAAEDLCEGSSGRSDVQGKIDQGLDGLAGRLPIDLPYVHALTWRVTPTGDVRLLKGSWAARDSIYESNYRRMLKTMIPIGGQPVMTEYGLMTACDLRVDEAGGGDLPTAAELLQVASINTKPGYVFLGNQPLCAVWQRASLTAGETPVLVDWSAGTALALESVLKAELGDTYAYEDGFDGGLPASMRGDTKPVVSTVTVDGTPTTITDEPTFLAQNAGAHAGTGTWRDMWQIPATTSERHGFAMRRAYALLQAQTGGTVADVDVSMAFPWIYPHADDVPSL